MKKIVLYATLVITLASCGGAKQFVTYTHGEPLSERKSRIYVMYKTKNLELLPTIITLFSNGERVGTIERKGYLAFDVPAGIEYALYATTGNREGYIANGAAGDDHFKINAKGGKIYYLRLNPKNRAIGRVYNLEYLDSAKGERKLKRHSRPKLNYVE